MKTTISVSRSTRDQLAEIATRDLAGSSMDEALKVIMFEYETAKALDRLEADPDALADYQAQMTRLAVDQVVYE